MNNAAAMMDNSTEITPATAPVPALVAENDNAAFCGVDMEEMTASLPCGGHVGGAAAKAALPIELISRLSLILPDNNESNNNRRGGSTTNNNGAPTFYPNSLLKSHYQAENNSEEEVEENNNINSTYLDGFCGPSLCGQLSEDENDPIPVSVMSNPNRSLCVVTTAALPWRTGTAVNPLLRALYLVRYQREHQHSSSSVALVIPWLESATERETLYGAFNKFSNGSKGMKEQELWIKKYAKERCDMENEANLLKYIWYPAFYVEGFGSIFPKVDLCNFIPSELVDVAILEEPEHLNWFRMPTATATSTATITTTPGDHCNNDANQSSSLEYSTTDDVDDAVDDEDYYDDASITLNNLNTASDGDVGDHQKQQQKQQLTKLGWTHRFNFVVGIVHTNYEEYARQYGIGASLIAAPAIGALSALTMRAHCHQVIKLSNTLPSFAPGKERTCNVHGVRREFLEESTTSANGSDDETSPVYFIGKLVWAKGFDVMIELQELFRKKSGNYFKIDIYGGGPDETAITRAFHGRNHSSPSKRPPTIKDSSSELSVPTDPKDLNAASLFANPNSIKTQSIEAIEQMKLTRSDSDVISQYLSLGFETSFSKKDVTYVKENREQPNKNADPLNILGDLSGKSFSTGVKTSQAVYNIADSSINNILKMSFSKLKKKVSGGEEPNFVFDPPKSRYEWRRHPIPAKFPGVIDHAQLNHPRHKIFLNPSTSEVLCTTSAEALAMGKFVIIPYHPSNEFFLQFTNCLAYNTLEECAMKLIWALENEPTPLSAEERRIFTWEAATERLMESSLVSIKEARERASNGMDKTDERIAYFLAGSGKIRGLFQK